MKTKLLILLGFLVFLITSCANSVPSLEINEYKPTGGKLDLKIAVILSKKLRELSHTTYITARCEVRGEKNRLVRLERKGTIFAVNHVGESVEKIFTKGVPFIFEKIDIYEDMSEIKNMPDYDYILIADFQMATSYDEWQALNRKTSKDREQYGPTNNLDKWRDLYEKSKFPIYATTEFIVKVVDAKQETLLNTFSSDYKYQDNSYADDCGHNPSLMNHYSRTIGGAMSAAFPVLLSNIETGMRPLAVAKAQEKALPSDLFVSTAFTDSSGFLPNTLIDAGEDSEIVVSIKNTGKGTGYSTTLEVTADNTKLNFNKSINAGDIQPNETKEIRLPLKSGLDIVDGKAAFTFNLKEKRGYDAKKVVMYVPTARLEKPQIEIASTEINDGEAGLAKGNGNGIPESGETVELTAFVRNKGEGKAMGVNLVGDNMTPGVQWVRDSSFIGTIQQGETIKAKTAFTIPRNFDSREISALLKASDVRGVSNTEKRVALNYAKQSPIVKYAYRILSKGNPVPSIINGGKYEVELTFENRGKIPAQDVEISLSSGGGVSLSSSKINLGDIKENASTPGRRFEISTLRTFGDKQAPIEIEISQKDFPSIKDFIQLPVDVKSPRLRYVANFQHGGNTLKKGDLANFELYAVNDGSLPAEGVSVKVESTEPGLKIEGKKEVFLGKIPANSKSESVKINVRALRSMKAGDSFLDVTLTQDEFPKFLRQYAINIVEDDIEVKDIAAEEVKSYKTTASKKQSGPAITVDSFKEVAMTSAISIPLAFEAADARNIDMIRVSVNGIKVFELNPASKKKRITQDITLDDGENKVVITARNADNEQTRKEFNIIRRADEGVDTPPAFNSKPRENDVAVVIGIENYRDTGLPRSVFSVNDAGVVRDYLKAMGFQDRNITYKTDSEASFSDIKKYIEEWLPGRVKKDSTVFIYYSGHGAPEVNTGDSYIVPFDGDPNFLSSTGYPLKRLAESLGKLDAKEIIVMLDSCFSGTGGRSVIAEGIRPLVLKKEGLVFKDNTVLLSATQGDQVSASSQDKKHGVFTYYFLKAIKEGKRNIKDIYEYVKPRVEDEAKTLNANQTPNVYPMSERLKDVYLLK